MKRGFTVLELLVASLLLAMLVTMLTMIFNQSSIAWSAGLLSVDDVTKERRSLGSYHDIEDDVLPGVAQNNAQTGSSDNRELRYRTVSLWKRGAKNTLRKNLRAFDSIAWDSGISTKLPNAVDSNVRNGMSVNATESGGSGSMGQNAGGGAAAVGVVVGVWSAGPDGKWSTDDDINTFPEEIK